MKKYFPIFFWWITFSSIWGIYRLFQFPEFFSEVFAKTIVWLGIMLLFLYQKIIPHSVVKQLKSQFLTTTPFGKIIIFPTMAIIGYFFLVNWSQIHLPSFSLTLVITTIIINFSTGIVEEIIYRGILYVWLLQKTDEFSAFIIVQVLFVLGHVPTLLINSTSITAALVHVFFIVLIGIFHTIVFRLTKSLYASALTHSIWNSLVYYLLLS